MRPVQLRDGQQTVPTVTVTAPSLSMLHEVRRAAKRIWRIWRSDVLVLSPAKSGRTWLRVLLSHVWHLAFGVPADRLIRFDNFHRLDRRIPVVTFSHLFNEPPPVRRAVARAIRSPRRRLVVLVRDPRDVAVSHYYHLRHRAHVRDLARYGLTRAQVARPLAEFLRDPGAGLPAQIDRLAAMLRLTERAARAHLLRYEDLRRDTAGELGRLLRFLGQDPDPSRLERAVAFAAFDNLRRLEQAGFFRDEVLRPADPNDPRSFKVRRGQSGSWRRELPADLVAWMDRLVAERLDPRLGYGGTGKDGPCGDRS